MAGRHESLNALAVQPLDALPADACERDSPLPFRPMGARTPRSQARPGLLLEAAAATTAAADAAPGTTKLKRSGQWSISEKRLFVQGLQRYGRDWCTIQSEMIQQRTLSQIRSHAQKFFLKRPWAKKLWNKRGPVPSAMASLDAQQMQMLTENRLVE